MKSYVKRKYVKLLDFCQTKFQDWTQILTWWREILV